MTRAGAVRVGRRGLLPRAGPRRPASGSATGRGALGLGGTVDALRLDRVLAGEHPASGEPLGRVVPSAGARVRPDVLGAEERERAVRDRRRRAARSDPATRTTGRSREALGVRRAGGRGDAARAGGARGDRRARVGRGGVPASDVAGRRSAAAHARPRREPRARRGRAVVDARRAADLRAREDRRLPVRGAAAGAADARARRSSGTPVRNGIADVDGVPPAVLRAFSRRRAEIEAELERRGASSAGGGAGRGAGDAARARTTGSRRSSSCRSGASALPSSGSIAAACARCVGRDASASARRARDRGASPSGSAGRTG